MYLRARLRNLFRLENWRCALGPFMAFVVVELDFYVYVCMLLHFSPTFGFGAKRQYVYLLPLGLEEAVYTYFFGVSRNSFAPYIFMNAMN